MTGEGSVLRLRTLLAVGVIAGFVYWIARPPGKPDKHAAAPPAQPRAEAQADPSPSSSPDSTTTAKSTATTTPRSQGRMLRLGLEPIPIHSQGGCVRDEDCPNAAYFCIANKPPFHFGRAEKGMCFIKGDCKPGGDDCGKDATCILDNGTPRCIPHGTQVQGGSCRDDAVDPKALCASGLTCLFRHCEAACSNQGGVCGNGGDCIQTGMGLFCTEPCDASTCKPGQQCLHTVDLGQRCAKPMGRDCTAGNVCSGSETCDSRFYDNEGGIVFFECRATCASDNDCPSGQVCGFDETESKRQCYRSCTADSQCDGRCTVVDAATGLYGCVHGPKNTFLQRLQQYQEGGRHE